jgi:ParB family chromosome partitioning protein
MDIPLDLILPNPDQPRTYFDLVALQELAASIRENGVIQPVVVEQAGDFYLLHDGERRCRAARIAGLTSIPAVVVPPLNGTGSRDRLLRALVANVQRADLNPIEEARAYARLRDEHGLKQLDIAHKCGVNTARVSSRLTLLQADPEVQELIARDAFPRLPNVVKALAEISDRSTRVALARKASEHNYRANTIIVAARKLAATPEQKRGKEILNETPAISRGLARAHRPLNLPKWDALAHCTHGGSRDGSPFAAG